MNRIAGILNLDNSPVDFADIERVLDALKLHAPDQHSVWVHEGAGFGRACIGTPAGKPSECLVSHSPDQHYLIVFDGRIDNRQELLAILKPQRSQDIQRVAAEELVLSAYEKWDLEFPKHLIGDFALAMWDIKKQRLICVRDQFGVKPFYYWRSKKSFLFASTVDALFASGQVLPVIYEKRIADLLMEFGGRGLEAIDKTSSFYRDVYRLPPAHMLIITRQGTRLERYWEVCPRLQPELRTDQDFVERFRELFSEAVRCRMQDIPIAACMLSGGMDSSAIAGTVRKILEEQGQGLLHSFAVISNSLETNRETFYVSSVIAQGTLHSHVISETELLPRMDELVRVIEEEAEPFDCLMNLNRAVYLHARDYGINALSDGIDGDLLLSDSFYLPSLWRHGDFRNVFAETLKADGLIAEYGLGRRYFLESLPIAFIPEWLIRLLRQFRDSLRASNATANAVESTIINRDLAESSHLENRIAQLASYSILPPFSSQMDAHKIDLDHPNLPAGLERYERVASSFGIEARHPFTDIRLAEFCLGLPWHLKTRRGWTKYILRRAMEPYLPAEVIWRRDKDSLMWEVNRLVLKARAEYFYQVTYDEQANLKPYVDVKKLAQFWQEYLTRGDETHAELIWSGIALALWLRRQRELQASWRKKAA